MKKRSSLLKMIISALFLALAYVLPYLTGQIPEIGSMLSPLHMPVLICGFICGWPWGLLVGFLAPLLRSITGVPVFFPNAVCMSLELAAYGGIAGLMHQLLPRKKMYIYCALLIAMFGGRIVWGVAMAVCLNMSGEVFTLQMFLAGAFTKAIPGIVIQIVLIPILVMFLENPKVISWRE